MEAAVRTACYLLTGQELAKPELQPLRGMKSAKELHTRIGNLEVGAAVVSGLANARKLLEEIQAGRKDLQFIEVMTCPGGCINGGGQPIGANINAARARMQALYKIDQGEKLRTSHRNPWVTRLYEEFLGKPLGEKSHHLLHTHYDHREVL
jgi:NADH-quinone oxidoreductase subunit G/NADP-reducing hydrogenase subunit HndD